MLSERSSHPGNNGFFCWQSKTAREHIRQCLDGDDKAGIVLGLYDALSEIASDEGKQTFTCLQSQIALKSGFSTSTAKRYLPVLASIGLLHIESPKLKQKCAYTLLALSEPALAPTEPALALSKKPRELTLYKEKKEKEETPLPPKGELAGGFSDKEKGEIASRLNKLFRRKDSTRWSDKEKRAFNKLWPLDPNDLALVETYYMATPAPVKDYRRRDMATLLNNWPGEVDRARAFADGGHGAGAQDDITKILNPRR